MKLEDINLTTWFSERQMQTHCPNHFVFTRTRLTSEALHWVNENTHGRYAVVSSEAAWEYDVVAFEDKKDAIMYELTWS
tara:strand:+ start:48 stop:284 length:237 start_codon:yes stop_codon:yes gene_type:complete